MKMKFHQIQPELFDFSSDRKWVSLTVENLMNLGRKHARESSGNSKQVTDEHPSLKQNDYIKLLAGSFSFSSVGIELLLH